MLQSVRTETERVVSPTEKRHPIESALHRGINSDEFGSKTTDWDVPEPTEWNPGGIRHLTEELENTMEDRDRDSRAERVRVLSEDLEAALKKSKNPNSDLAHPLKSGGRAKAGRHETGEQKKGRRVCGARSVHYILTEGI